MKSTDFADSTRAVFRVALSQTALGLLVWGGLGFWTVRQAWLLGPEQQDIVKLFFRRELPLFGIALTVVLPSLAIWRLAGEVDATAEPETSLIRKLLEFPRQVAVVDMISSVMLFLFGALLIRRVAMAPAMEAAKIEILGLVTGVLYGVLSYFLLQPVTRPLLAVAMAGGAVPPERAVFPLTQKIGLICLALALVVVGLVGEIGLSWTQRFSELRAEETARERLRQFAGRAELVAPKDARGWQSILNQIVSSGETIFVIDSFGRKLASAPKDPDPPDGRIVSSQELRERLARSKEGVEVFRRGSVRVATILPVAHGWRLVLLTPPDGSVVASQLRSLGAIGLEILLVAIGLAWAVGNGISAPLGEIERRTKRFALDPRAAAEESWAADDEFGRVFQAFSRMEREIVRMQDRLRESDRRAAATELLAGVAHEVRNPLFGITTTIEAIGDELGGDPRFQEHLALIRKESARLARLMDEMLLLNRPPRRSESRVALAALLRAAEAGVRRRHADRVMTLSVDCPDDLMLGDVDADRMESVFANLFENALLSSSDPARIACRASTSDGSVHIEVEDSGAGIDPSVRGNLFEPFVTSRPGGTGMGLALCRNIIEEHGGRIGVETPSGAPVRFTVDLPQCSREFRANGSDGHT